MMKKSKRSLTPKLRFPEFREEWQHATIGEIFNPDDKPVKATRFESDKILTVRLHANGVVRNERTGALTGGANYFTRRAGQFIFSKIDLLNGAFGIIPKQFDGFYSSSDVPAFSFGIEHSPAFFLNWLTCRYQRLDVERTGTSATLKRVSPEKFLELPILLPTPPEQQKIADCLSSLDELITAEGRKLEALRDHKKGLMQQLFPQPGETQPRLRFPEFRGKGEWKRHTLSHYISALGAGVSVNSGDRPVRNREIGVLKTSCVSTGTFDPTENKVVLKREELGRVKEPVQRDTIIISRMNTIELVGANAYVESENTNLYLPDRLWAAKPTGNGNMRFLSYILGSDQGRAFLSSLASGSSGSMKNISKFEVLAMPTLVPSIVEQQRITTCLTALDTQITAQAAKIESLKTHKSGLMQQLFPAPEEVEA